MFDIEENLKTLPDRPGVYLHKDAYGEVIYVGKALSLRKRVRQYFRAPAQRDPKSAALVSHIAEFETIITQTEMEALILENTLIKKYMPRYNVMLRDDKTYPYIKITLGEEWPRIEKTRVLKNDGSKYFGPYADVGSVNRIIELLCDAYRLKHCRTVKFADGARPCVYGHIGKCRAFCSAGAGADREGYLADINKVMSFLKGHDKETIDLLKKNMESASAAEDFEKAAYWRDMIFAARSITRKQRVDLLSSGNMDIVLAHLTEQEEADVEGVKGVESVGGEEAMESVRGVRSKGDAGDVMAMDSADEKRDVESKGDVGDVGSVRVTNGKGGMAQVTVFFVRDGRLSGREIHHLDVPELSTKEEVVSAFMLQYYISQTALPKQILLESHIEEETLLQNMLTENAGRSVKIEVPVRGEKKALLKLAQADISETSKLMLDMAEREREKEQAIYSALVEATGHAQKGGQTLRIEAYDISNTGGADSVGAMVVFEGMKPDKSSYRRFRIRGDVKGDDYAAMQEVLYRRLRRAQEASKGFERRPDIILIDGGRGHVATALEITEAMGEKITVAGMVKDDRHRTRGLVAADGSETDLKTKPALFSFVGKIQEEVHRFAIEYHRGVRKRKAVRSQLDEIPSIGEKRRNALLTAFGSIDALRTASEEAIAAVPGMNAKAARAVYEYFRSEAEE